MMANNRRGGGGLVQLVAYGAPDVFLTGNTGCAQGYNLRDSMMHWFVDRDDGQAVRSDLPTQSLPSRDRRAWFGNNVLAHVPASMAPRTAEDGTTIPFTVRELFKKAPPKVPTAVPLGGP
jgi:hypothetical protein